MITIRLSEQRGQVDFGWLKSKHTFSFGNYYDSDYMGFGNLRVINEDRVIPGQGFGSHPHRDMEIISYVLQGELEHRDSLGNGSIIRPGDVQRMSAGTGIIHSEFNASDRELVHFLQIWILPNQKGIKPSYEQKHFPLEEKQGKLRLVASPDGKDNSVTIHQDVELYVAVLNKGDRLNHVTENHSSVWVQVARGAAQVNHQTINTGDGAAITKETQIEVTALRENTEIILFDLT